MLVVKSTNSCAQCQHWREGGVVGRQDFRGREQNGREDIRSPPAWRAARRIRVQDSRFRVGTSASERRRNQSKGFKNFYLKAKARVWPWMSCLCHVRPTVVAGFGGNSFPRRTRRGACESAFWFSLGLFALTCLVSPSFFSSKVDGFVPQTQHVNLRMVGQIESDRPVFLSSIRSVSTPKLHSDPRKRGRVLPTPCLRRI